MRQLSDNHRLRLVIPVPESAVSRIHLGGPVALTVRTLDKTLTGTVARFSDRLDSDTRTMHVEVDVPNGSLYSARHAEAVLRAQAEDEGLREVETQITRDVSVAWQSVKTAYQKVDLTNQLLAQASDALELAQARYDLGLSSIVELTQAELNKTEA